MAPHSGHGTGRPAHRTANGGPSRNASANSISLGRPQGPRSLNRQEGSRAKETQRKRDRRDRRSESKVPRKPNPTVSLGHLGLLADRATHSHGGEAYTSTTYDGAYDPSPRPQQGRTLQERITRDAGFNGDGGSVQSLSLSDCHQDQAEYTDTTTTRDDAGMVVDDFADLFVSEPPLPRPLRQVAKTKPIQYGSYHLPFNRYLHPPRPIQPETRCETFRLLNSSMPYEPEIDGPLPGFDPHPPSSPPAKAPGANKHPVNPYKGNDPVKRRVQNKLLRYILADKPLPKPRKKADRMVLKCAGRQEFR